MRHKNRGAEVDINRSLIGAMLVGVLGNSLNLFGVSPVYRRIARAWSSCRSSPSTSGAGAA